MDTSIKNHYRDSANIWTGAGGDGVCLNQAANTTGLFLEDSQGVIDLKESLRKGF